MSLKPRSPWAGFLPPNAIIMSRRAIASEPALKPSAPSTTFAPVVFISSDQAEDEALLGKMVEAMGLGPNEHSVIYLGADSEQVLESLEACKPSPKVIISLGDSTYQRLCDVAGVASPGFTRGQFTEWHGIRLMPTFAPGQIKANTTLKKEVWADLQSVMREMGKVKKP
jgi:hypothetical protein